jgi:hypothetical protein
MRQGIKNGESMKKRVSSWFVHKKRPPCCFFEQAFDGPCPVNQAKITGGEGMIPPQGYAGMVRRRSFFP